MNWDGLPDRCTCHGDTWIVGAGTSGIGVAGPGCCGDDMGSDNWCAGGYTSCYVGAYYGDGDSNQYTCDCGGAGLWGLGGEVAAIECCGDDPGEYKRTRLCNSWCANDPGDDACCNADNKCVYSGACYNSGVCYSDDAYCGMGTWYDSDADSSYCDACLGPGQWNIGGEVSTSSCCGDESIENYITCQDNGEGYCSLPGDKAACCDSLTDCVSLDGNCRGDGYTSGSWICDAGTWHDFMLPSTTNNASSDWTATDQTVTLTCVDAGGSSCDRVRYCVGTRSCAIPVQSYDISSGSYDVPVTCPADSVCRQYVRYQSSDAAGNWEGVKTSVETRIDKEAPVTTVSLSGTLGMNGWYTSDVSVTLACGDGTGYGCPVAGATEYCTDQPPASPCTPNLPYTVPLTISDEGTSFVRYYSADGLGNTEMTEFTEIRIDRTAPAASVDPLPEWTNASDGFNVDFPVTWRGSDAVSGIAAFDIQYRKTDRATGSVEQVWTDWLTNRGATGPPENMDSDSFYAGTIVTPGLNNRTFEFRARATDNAGLVSVYSAAPYSNTNIDVAPPVCSVGSLPGYHTTGTFNVVFQATEGESGMAIFEGMIRGPDGAGGWRDILDNCFALTPMDGADTVTLECNGLGDGLWEFRSIGTDIADNTGEWSPVESTTVDTSEPNLQITEPLFVWTPQEQFTLSWAGGDSGPSGLDHYDVYYHETAWPGGPGGPWTPWLTDTQQTTATFGGGSPALAEGQTYYINVTATDGAGNRVSDVINVTIDRTSPFISLLVLDQNWNPIQPGWISPGSDVELINITSNASDGLSGILSNTIEYLIYGEAPDHKWLECGESPSPGYSACSTAGSNPYGWEDIQYDDTTSVRYRVLARDMAGNENITSYYFTVSHPLANFASASFHIYLGESRLVPVMVRNIQDETDNITLSLTGYPFAEFEYECDPSDCIISAGTRSMVALNVNPYEERRYFVRVVSSEPGEESLILNASSSLDPLLEDSHSISISTSYPAYFPGLGSWAIALLLVIAGIAYGALSGNKPGAAK